MRTIQNNIQAASAASGSMYKAVGSPGIMAPSLKPGIYILRYRFLYFYLKKMLALKIGHYLVVLSFEI